MTISYHYPDLKDGDIQNASSEVNFKVQEFQKNEISEVLRIYFRTIHNFKCVGWMDERYTKV